MKKTLLLAVLLLAFGANAQIKINFVSPATDEIRIKNFGSGAVDISTYRLCALFDYNNLSELGMNIISGDFNLGTGEEVAFSWTPPIGFNITASDLGLNLPTGAFSTPTTMVDFMQYGASGQGREGVANTAGLWTSGQFLTGTGPWYYIGDGSVSGLTQWSDQPPLVGPYTGVRINEIDPDQPSTDMDEFIELFGDANAALDGLILVLFSGADDLAYGAYDLDGQSLDENGYFVLGSSTVPNVDMLLTGAIQNGADAAAIYVGDASGWPNGTPASSTGLLDAVVYGTEDDSDAGLLATLTPGEVQLDDIGNTGNSFSRVPDGGDAFDLTSYLIQTPTPGVSNIPLCSGALIEAVSGELNQCSEIDNDPIVVSTTSLYGDNYIYVLADVLDFIIITSIDGSFEMDGQPDGDFHIWGFSYNGTLDLSASAPGLPISGMISSDCYALSNNFIPVNRTVCTVSDCDGGMVQTESGNTYVSLCSDAEADEYTFTNVNIGNADSYTYILADGVGNIIQLIAGTSFDFNTLPVGDYYIHGLSYYAGLDPQTTEPGDPLIGLSTLGVCLDLSDNTIEVHVLDCALVEGCTLLYFSEYMEGTANNKAIEIYNPTPFPIDMSDYDLKSYANGSMTVSSVVALAGTLQPGDVFVIANSQAGAEILAVADMTASLATFSGNDAIELLYNLVPIDVIGIVGVDPGTAGWQFGLGSTTDHVLVRNLSTNSPTTNWALSQGEWLIYSADDFSHLGSHAAIACSGEAFISFEVTALQVEETAGVVELSINAYNVSVDVPITINITNASATAGADFVDSTPITLIFTPANTFQTITVEIIDDLEEEDNYEYLTLTMTDDDDLATFVNQSVTISIEPSDQNYTLYTIAEISNEDESGIADSMNVFCAITGIVHGINFNPTGTEFTLIQGVAGIKVFDATNAYGYSVADGDSIIVYGQVTQFLGLTQFFPDAIFFIDGGHELESPIVITELSEATESHIVQMNCVEVVDPSQWTQESSGFDVDLTDGTNIFTMHVDLNTDIYAVPVPEGHFNVVGIGGQWDATSPFDSSYVFWPRMLTDLSGHVIASFTMPGTIIFGESDQTVDFVNNSEGAVNYDWDFGDGSIHLVTELASHDYTYAFLSGVAEVAVTLTVDNGAGCSDTFTTTVDAVYMSVEENDAADLLIYPNPADDKFNVVCDKEIVEYRIIDINGRVVLNEKNGGRMSRMVDIEFLPSGLYHLEFVTSSKIFDRKLLVR